MFKAAPIAQEPKRRNRFVVEFPINNGRYKQLLIFIIMFCFHWVNI